MLYCLHGSLLATTVNYFFHLCYGFDVRGTPHCRGGGFLFTASPVSALFDFGLGTPPIFLFVSHKRAV